MSLKTFDTQYFKLDKLPENEVQTVLVEVYTALLHKGYNPVNQMVGYLMSGDPTYITSYENSRGKITRVSRDEILEELVKAFVDCYGLAPKEEEKDESTGD